MLGLALLVGGARAGTPAQGYTDALVVRDLAEPTAIAFLPDGRMVVVEKRGGVLVVSGGTIDRVGTVGVCTGSEMGLLGVAVDPGFASTRRLYFYRTENVGGCDGAAGRSNQIVRTTLVDDALGPFEVLLDGIRTDNGNHDGGGLRVGPDGHLWAGIGDTGRGDFGAPGEATNPYAQDLGALEGKIVRITPTGGVPEDNPFVGRPGARPEVWASGFRNPFRIGFDPVTGALWAGDVGQSTVEEIDRVGRGGNHAWPHCEGHLPTGCARPDDVRPAHVYVHGGRSAAVTGGAFATGGALAGHYYFGDFLRGTIWHATLDPTRTLVQGTPDVVLDGVRGPVDFVFGPDGQLYYVAYLAGEVRRLGHPDFGAGPAVTTTTTVSASTTTTDGTAKTTTTTASASTTTLAPPACAEAPTQACVGAALDALVVRAAALAAYGQRFAPLGRLAERGRAKALSGTPRRLRRAARILDRLARRVGRRAARRRIPEGVRTDLRAAARGAAALVRALARA